MKGIIFKEFLNLVNDTFDERTEEELFNGEELESQGAYTSAGTYNYKELLTLIERLSHITQIDSVILINKFSQHMVSFFYKNFPEHFVHDTFNDFLKSIESNIHVEVRKLYPDAQLPQFTFEELDNHVLKVTYQSLRPFAPLAEGLIRHSRQYFQEQIDVYVPSQDINPYTRVFLIKTGGDK